MFDGVRTSGVDVRFAKLSFELLFALLSACIDATVVAVEVSFAEDGVLVDPSVGSGDKSGIVVESVTFCGVSGDTSGNVAVAGEVEEAVVENIESVDVVAIDETKSLKDVKMDLESEASRYKLESRCVEEEEEEEEEIKNEEERVGEAVVEVLSHKEAMSLSVKWLRVYSKGVGTHLLYGAGEASSTEINVVITRASVRKKDIMKQTCEILQKK